MGNRLTDGEKVVVSVFVTLFAGGVGGLYFFGTAILEMKDAISELQVSVAELRRDIGDLQEDVTTLQEDVATLQEDVATLQEDMVLFRAEVSGRLDALEGRRSALGVASEAPHGALPRSAN